MAEVKSLDVLLLKSIFSKIDYPCNVEFIDSLWTMDECQITWNEDDSEKDLLDGEGNTYSIEYYSGWIEFDGYIVVNGDNGCGDTITYFFKHDKEL